MLVESIIIAINIILSMFYKEKFELSSIERKIIKNLSIILQIFLLFNNLYFIFPFAFLFLYNFRFRKKILIISNIFINYLIYLLFPNPFVFLILILYNPLILWTEL
ncbi:MAG: hypothetical protein QXM04_01825 [Nanopusillaceae archaeon]